MVDRQMMDRQPGSRQADRQMVDRQPGRWVDRQTDVQADGAQAARQMGGQADM